MKKGFTLIELIIIVAIVGILAATIISNVTNPCVRSHTERGIVRYDQHGSSMYPIYGEITVCDQRKSNVQPGTPVKGNSEPQPSPSRSW